MRHTKTTRERKGWLRFGCYGCFGVVAITILIIGGMVGLALVLGRPPERIEQSSLVRPLPPSTSPAEPTDVGTSGFPELAGGEPGRVVLDLSMGNFDVVAGEPGDPIRVDGRYDVGAYELTESFETQGESSWVYRVHFGRKVSWLRHLFGDSAGKNRIRLTLPRDLPMRLEGKIGVGQSSLELGGLWLVSSELDIGVGEHAVRFGEPLPEPMERLELVGSVGELRIGTLGNASPRSCEVRSRIGELALDLGGAWRTDSSVAVRCGIGECRVRVPDSVAIELASASVGIGEKNISALSGLPKPEAGVPTLRLDVSNRIGELRIDR